MTPRPYFRGMSHRLEQPDRPWMMRTYAGHSTARKSNELYRRNLAKGQTGLSIAFDLPTQTGYDADHELARGYDERRGAQVIAEADRLLDAYFPLEGASHADVTTYRLDGGALAAQTADGTLGLADPEQLVGYRGDPGAPKAVLLRRQREQFARLQQRAARVAAD